MPAPSIAGILSQSGSANAAADLLLAFNPLLPDDVLLRVNATTRGTAADTTPDQTCRYELYACDSRPADATQARRGFALLDVTIHPIARYAGLNGLSANTYLHDADLDIPLHYSPTAQGRYLALIVNCTVVYASAAILHIARKTPPSPP